MLMVSGTSKSFSLHVRCPYGDHDDWIILQGRLETLEQLLAAPCAFECPTHGVQMEYPLEGVEKPPSSSGPQKRSPLFSPGASKKPRRSSDRKAFYVPVVVYGWSKALGSFHEDTTTILFNASGALVRLATPVDLGESLFLVSKLTREEQEVRVVFKEPRLPSGYEVGLAFSKPVPNFWRKTRRSQRAREALRVFVRGKDRSGNPFTQSSYTLDISEDGARLDGVAYLTTPGEVIEVNSTGTGKELFAVGCTAHTVPMDSTKAQISGWVPGMLPCTSQ